MTPTPAGALSLGAASLWLGLLVGALALILVRVVPGLNPAWRYRIWYSALGLMLLLPIAIVARSTGEAMAHPSATAVSEQVPAAPPTVIARQAPAGDSKPGLPTDQESPAVSRQSREWGWRLHAPARILDWLVWIWLAGFALGTTRLTLEAGRLARLRRQARPPSHDLLQIWSDAIRSVPTGRTLRLLVSEHISVPMACGWFRPAVMLPSRFDQLLTLEETRHLLMHELAHLARRDDWHQMICQLAGVICWWHPLIRWVIGRLEAEGEFACDEVVAQRTGRRLYARTLVRVAGLAIDRTIALAPAASRGQLSERVESLVGAAATDPAWRRTLAGLTLGSLTAAGIWLGPPVIGVRAEAPAAAAERPEPGPAPGVVGEELDRIFSRFADSGFSGTILVAMGDQIVLEKGYGWADRDRQIRATAATRYSTAGITKLFTAAAILTLEEEGRLTVRDTLARWTGPLPEAKQGVTLHQLLTHTDGLTRLQAPVYRRLADDFVAAVRATPAAFAPGTGYRYNDFGHSLLGLVVERASGERYEDFIRRRFLKPAGMAATGFEGEGGPVALEYAGRAGGLVPIPERAYVWGRRGSLGMVSTAGDLYQWFRAMSDPRVLSPRVRERMLTPMERSDWGAEQGYGWDFQSRPGGHRLWRRVAGTPGFEGELLHDPVAGWTAVILVNSRLGWRFRVWEAIERAIRFSCPCPLNL